ncbi:MAG TPA: DUF669 domain-containing protein [Verrucomicrobiae bacterium]|nr:DUF669 domain-containing protein [Verrucomicrobiae bacterium]
MPLTVNFAGVPDQKSFDPVPAGEYELELQDYKEGTVKSETSANFGATKFDFTYEIVNCDEEKYNGRKIFDNVTITENSLWRLKAMLKAFGADVPEEGEIEVDFDDLLGESLSAKVGVQPARKVGTQEYTARNTIRQFMVPDED